MSAAQIFVGLCVTCNNSESCVYRKRRGTDALYCELYDGYMLSPVHRDASSAMAGSTEPTSTEAADHTGLCVNCQHRHDCGLARTEGGIWHCEEYE